MIPIIRDFGKANNRDNKKKWFPIKYYENVAIECNYTKK